MKKMSWRQGLAAFGATALLAGALAPAMALGAVSPGASGEREADPFTGDHHTEVWLSVTDNGATTLSVTAPLKVYLAVEIEEAEAVSGSYKEKTYDFQVPTAGVMKITNNSRHSKLALNQYTISDNTYGLKKITSAADATDGFYNAGATTFDETTRRTTTQGSYWLTAAITNATNVPVDVDFATETRTAPVDLSASETNLTMEANTASGNNNSSVLSFDLDGQIYGPNKDVTSYGADQGAQLNRIDWTFKVVS